jgi:hypothetical protein
MNLTRFAQVVLLAIVPLLSAAGASAQQKQENPVTSSDAALAPTATTTVQTPSKNVPSNAQDYLVEAMKTWVPFKNHTVNGEKEDDIKARYEATALDIAEVAFDPNEAPYQLYQGTPNARMKTALLVAGVGSLEGGFQKNVDDGSCNDPKYKAEGRGTCDGGQAWTIWQIHTFGGLILKGTGISSVQYDLAYARQHPDEVWTGPKLVKNRRMAAKIALRLMRYSFTVGGGLCQYAGEPCGKDAKHPLANNRETRGLLYLMSHPFIAKVEEDQSVAKND